MLMLCGVTVESGKGPAQVTLEGTTWWPPHTTSAFLASLSGTELGPVHVRSRGWLGGGETSRFQYQPSTRVVIFPVMFVGVQLKFVFLAERQEGQFGTHTTHMSSTMTWPSAWHWLSDS